MERCLRMVVMGTKVLNVDGEQKLTKPMEYQPEVLPRAFYRGRTDARKAVALMLLLIVSSFTVLTASGRIDPMRIFGPHVQRSEWAFDMTGARELAAMGLTGKGITVCIVDSGLDFLHPDFEGTKVLAWKDFVASRPEPYDDSAHGTAMAGLIAAHGSLRGVAPGVDLIVAKVVNASGDGRSQNVADGIRFCVDPWGDGRPGADIISISLGSKAPFFVENRVYDAVVWATSKGVLVVAAAGNDGVIDDGDVEITAVAPLSIAVGAVDIDERRAPFSSMGSSANRTDPNLKPELVAPGVRIVSTGLGARYITVTGTSPATAMVAGILALILEARPSLRSTGDSTNILMIKEGLALGASKVAGQVLPHDPWYGYGIVNGPGVLSNL